MLARLLKCPDTKAMDSEFIDRRIMTSRMILARYLKMALGPTKPSFSSVLFESEVFYLSSLKQSHPERAEELEALIAAWKKLSVALDKNLE